ncbi:Anaerobic glycerol-3-phosphate dehydrogenase subunit C [invertebrate metagenome]|uniref:Anaerobic glycerol-3-phosphate dehydrogenase subunit C n=1 Tax=invertebrate metagenome TaxID=1711999 RepID=A0A2H9T8H7_9ZZZZ
MLDLTDTTFDSCIKCTICTTHCPVAEATSDFPGPKQAGPDGRRLRLKNPGLYDEALKFCTNCKRCDVSCPSGVHISHIIQGARKEAPGGFKRSPRDFMLSHTDLMGSLSSPLAPVVNTITAAKPVKKLLDKTLGIDEHRIFPKYTQKTFRHWFAGQKEQQEVYSRFISYFHGCYINYNDPTVGKDLVKVMNAMNIGVHLLDKERCCGVPLIANGFYDKARQNAHFNLKQFSQGLESGADAVIATSSSCAMTLRDEYPDVLAVDNRAIKKQIQFISHFLVNEISQGNLPKLKPVNLTVAYHSPCHLVKMGGVIYTLELLSHIPGLKLIQLDQNCCGLAGTYGFKKENYKHSQKIAGKMIQQIQATNADYVVTDCESCKMQIEMSTQHKVLHPISLLAMALKNYS